MTSISVKTLTAFCTCTYMYVYIYSGMDQHVYNILITFKQRRSVALFLEEAGE